MNAPPTKRFSVAVQEDGDVSIYFCEEEPQYVYRPIEDDPDNRVLCLKFIPRNGNTMRVNKINYVPNQRVLAIIEDESLEKWRVGEIHPGFSRKVP